MPEFTLYFDLHFRFLLKKETLSSKCLKTQTFKKNNLLKFYKKINSEVWKKH